MSEEDQVNGFFNAVADMPGRPVFLREIEPMRQLALKGLRTEGKALEELARVCEHEAAMARASSKQQSNVYMQYLDRVRSAVAISIWEQAAALARSYVNGDTRRD